MSTRKGYALTVILEDLPGARNVSLGLKRTCGAQGLYHTLRRDAVTAAQTITELHEREVIRVDVSRVEAKPYVRVYAGRMEYL